MTKSELAKQAGVCLSAVVQWEHPQGTTPNAANLARVAQITDVAFEWLATGRGAWRLANADEPAAVDPIVIANTFFEEQLLQIARKLPAQHHELLIALLRILVEKS